MKDLHHIPASLKGVDHAAPSSGITCLQILLKFLGVLSHIVQQTCQVPRILQSHAPQALPGPLRRPYKVRIHRLSAHLSVRLHPFVGIKRHMSPPRLSFFAMARLSHFPFRLSRCALCNSAFYFTIPYFSRYFNSIPQFIPIYWNTWSIIYIFIGWICLVFLLFPHHFAAGEPRKGL